MAPADVVAILIVWLRPQLAAPANIGAKLPEPRGTFVLIRRVGGTWIWPHVDDVTLTVEVWAPTHALAHDLIQDVRARIHSLQGGIAAGVPFYRIEEFAAPAWLPDPESEEPRYTMTLSVRHREHLEVSA
jgi:hypothetical protein